MRMKNKRGELMSCAWSGMLEWRDCVGSELSERMIERSETKLDEAEIVTVDALY